MAHGFCRDVLSYTRLCRKESKMMGPRSVTKGSEIRDSVTQQGQTEKEIREAAEREELAEHQQAEQSRSDGEAEDLPAD